VRHFYGTEFEIMTFGGDGYFLNFVGSALKSSIEYRLENHKCLIENLKMNFK
jgi:hypothetical protein